nr:hypothetical protein [Nocardia wallacei]
MAGWIAEEGLSLDVCSGGELAVALAAGVVPGASTGPTSPPGTGPARSLARCSTVAASADRSAPVSLTRHT